jgi:hypothetical protein
MPQPEVCIGNSLILSCKYVCRAYPYLHIHTFIPTYIYSAQFYCSPSVYNANYISNNLTIKFSGRTALQMPGTMSKLPSTCCSSIDRAFQSLGANVEAWFSILSSIKGYVTHTYLTKAHMINNNYASCINTVLKDVLCFLILSVVCTLFIANTLTCIITYIHLYRTSFGLLLYRSPPKQESS